MSAFVPAGLSFVDSQPAVVALFSFPLSSFCVVVLKSRNSNSCSSSSLSLSSSRLVSFAGLAVMVVEKRSSRLSNLPRRS